VLALLATPLVRSASGQYLDPELIESSLDVRPEECRAAFGYTNEYMCIWLKNAFSITQAFPYVDDPVNPGRKKGIAAYEVLNEENRYLNGGGKGLSPSSVATLLAKFYRVFKDNGGLDGSFHTWNQDVDIILGGLHPDRCEDCGSTGMRDREYLDTIYKSGAFQSYRTANGRYPLDGVGYHPYPMEMRSGLMPEPTGYDDLFRLPARMTAIRQRMIDNGDIANQIWITEVGDRGAPTTVDPDGDNERRQANFLKTIYWMLWQHREYVHTVFWFKYEDFAVPEDDTKVGPENWGVVRLERRSPSDYQCPTCEYAPNGAVEVYKQSFFTYMNMAASGAGLETYSVSLPVVGTGLADQ
jgi:hypothetical protein